MTSEIISIGNQAKLCFPKESVFVDEHALTEKLSSIKAKKGGEIKE